MSGCSTPGTSAATVRRGLLLAVGLHEPVFELRDDAGRVIDGGDPNVDHAAGLADSPAFAVVLDLDAVATDLMGTAVDPDLHGNVRSR